MEQPFKLAASLSGHDDDVRGVSFPNPSTLLSASRDATVRLWKLQKESPPTFDDTIVAHGGSFMSTVALIPPSPEFPEGLVASGSRDGLIDLRTPNSKPEQDPHAVLIGHGNNVCALDVSQDGKFLVSGSWDMSARVWEVGKWHPQQAKVLSGHEGTVWAVLALNSKMIVTGSADKSIRIFDYSGKPLHRFPASNEVVRALCRLPESRGGAQFASAGNDSKIRLWTVDGALVSELDGHDSFIYSLALLPNGDIASSSEDRTVRIWRDKQCIQTIVHPAISVWSVAACQETGDIVSGASDKVVRVFSRQPQRQADEDTLKQFEDAVKSSSIPQQSLGEINKTDLPGPEFLQQKSGTKEGQVQMIKESNGSVTAYQWSQSANTWVSVGTVVDAAGSANKVSYNGQDYDYVFDVDIEDGKPALKLPYNANENPYEVARKFITVNELSMNYIDQVADFIVKNSQGTALGNTATPEPSGSDPWGTGARYRPGDGASQAPPPPAAAPKVLPQKQYLAITTGNHQMILKKIQEFNTQLLAEGIKDLVLNDTDLQDLSGAMTSLAAAANKSQATITLKGSAVALGVRGATEWPIGRRLPWLDYLRLVTAAAGPETVRQSSQRSDLVARLAAAGAFDRNVSSDNSVMLAVRVLANLFVSVAGRRLAHAEFEQVLRLVEPLPTAAVGANKNLGIALATLYINYAVLLTSSATDGDEGDGEADAGKAAPDTDRALALLAALVELLRHAADAETVYRALVGAGTVLCLGRDFADVAREGLGIDEVLGRAASLARKEERIAALVAEISTILGA